MGRNGSRNIKIILKISYCFQGPSKSLLSRNFVLSKKQDNLDYLGGK